MIEIIQNIINEYEKSHIQSEAEVRSKLIVPLLGVLGYPDYLRAEEFPVYEFEGRKSLPAKNADFILFSDKHFAEHRKFSEEDINWVYKNSLLIVEAKKPNEMPEINGQPIFYTIWTRAVAYFVTDGVQIKGYFYNNINSDLNMFDCPVEELADNSRFFDLSYENLIRIKNKRYNPFEGIAALKDIRCGVVIDKSEDGKYTIADANTVGSFSEDDLNDIPESTFQYMENALGKNAAGLDKSQILSKFINTTDAILNNDLRYDVPKYIFDIERKRGDASLYINNVVLPFLKGQFIQFYYEEYDRFLFLNEYIQIDIVYKSNELLNFEIGFTVLDPHVSERLNSFEFVKRVLNSNNILIILNDEDKRRMELPSGLPGDMWTSKSRVLSMCDFYQSQLGQMSLIEKFYNITFSLKYVNGINDLNELYDAVSFVYDGISMNENCKIIIPSNLLTEDIEIKEPILFPTVRPITLPSRTIHSVQFVPDQMWVMPGIIHKGMVSETDDIRVPGCCRYKVVNADG